jgi:hypothetical protein
LPRDFTIAALVHGSVYNESAVLAKLSIVATAACAAPITVRMAHDHEFARPAVVTAASLHCHLEGAPVPEWRAALIGFARDHLLATVGGNPRSAYSSVPIAPVPDGTHYFIAVDPRTKLGQLEVRRATSWRSASIYSGESHAFCVHHVDGALVLERAWGSFMMSML